MAGPASAAPLASKPVPPKDLINLRNPKNGEVYRFSCKTCIDGHRAPLCDPNKHYGKVVFRRPNPGRPARQCGHPKQAQCDCLAKRTLCCKLTDDEWEQVREGKVVTVTMYDSLDDLNHSALEAQPPQPMAFPTLPQRGPIMYHPYSNVRMQMMGIGGPQGNVDPPNDPFDWNGMAPRRMPANSAATRSRRQGSNPSSLHQSAPTSGPTDHLDQLHTFQANPQPLEDLHRTAQHAQFGQFQVDMPNSMEMHSRRPAFGRLDTRTPLATPGPPSEVSTPIENSAVALHRQLSIHQELSQLSPAMQECYLRNSSPIDAMSFSPSVAMSPVSDMDIGMGGLEVPTPPPTQSCCSRSPRPPRQVTQRVIGQWPMPPADPRSQFPCPNCASTMCTCSNCPSTMQSLSGGGAWAQACGRQGHLDNPFPPAFSAQLLQNGHASEGDGHVMDDVEKFALSPTEAKLPVHLMADHVTEEKIPIHLMAGHGPNGHGITTTSVSNPDLTADATVNPSMLQYQGGDHGMHWSGF
ncbi:hypothetical protein K461DRAFT_292857 [Myriangium duriaei CBS 260.36]|uniref:Copper-fist domain-containing protein n=1 Tax=Myriangium duriaei CBS 260.36 TaxID=1168546 RepID=A0A9P4J4Y3_9PEZI|nr:hypothetical protein K461DRAFT_292857 [Myriangium duriaei CBS 260.36]